MAGKGTIFYVHGAGNREDQASEYEGKLRAGLGLSTGSSSLRRSHWGQQRGPDSTLPRLDDVLPPVAAPDVGLAPVLTPETALADPLAPLRALAPGPGEAAFAAGSPDADQVLQLLRAGLVDLSEIGISAGSLQAAAATVAASPEYAAAAGRPSDIVDAALESVARAALAKEGAGAFGVGDILEAVRTATSAIANALLGSGVLSVAGPWLKTRLGPPAMLALSRHLAPERGRYMRQGVLVPTDVLFYQRNGQPIRDFVRGEIAALEPPVVAIGHSLGGIILVDTLFSPGAPKTGVTLLVTFGSQSAYLQSVGSLGPLSPSIPWVNIWTRYDFVSFLAEEMWPGKVRDLEVEIEVGFPDAHGAYYDTPGFYDAIKAQPAIKGVLG